MDSSESTCEEKTFRGLFMKHLDSLRNFFYYKSGDRALAEDLAQEAFLRLWKNCAKVPVAKARSFLFTIANNLFLDETKHRKVKLEFQLRNSHKSSAVAQRVNQESPEFLLEEQEFKVQLERAINALSERQREVFLMNRIDKMKYREIAVALGISQKAVEKRMHNALLKLRELTHKI